jgi:hypothetical protein
MRVSSGQNAMHAPGRAKTLAIKQTIHDVPPQYLCSQHAARSERVRLAGGNTSSWSAVLRAHGRDGAGGERRGERAGTHFSGYCCCCMITVGAATIAGAATIIFVSARVTGRRRSTRTERG